MLQGIKAKSLLMPLSNQEAKLYSYGLVGLKGFLFKRFAEQAADKAGLIGELYENPTAFIKLLNTQTMQQMELPMPEVVIQSKANKSTKVSDIEKVAQSDESGFLSIPDVPPAANIGLGMRYYIPEWDDHVDPNYDFLNSQLTPGRDPYEDEVYAHRILSATKLRRHSGFKGRGQRTVSGNDNGWKMWAFTSSSVMKAQ